MANKESLIAALGSLKSSVEDTGLFVAESNTEGLKSVVTSITENTMFSVDYLDNTLTVGLAKVAESIKENTLFSADYLDDTLRKGFDQIATTNAATGAVASVTTAPAPEQDGKKNKFLGGITKSLKELSSIKIPDGLTDFIKAVTSFKIKDTLGMMALSKGLKLATPGLTKLATIKWKSLKGVGETLTAMKGFKAKDALGLFMLGKALKSATPALKGFADISWVKAKKAIPVLESLGVAFKNFGTAMLQTGAGLILGAAAIFGLGYAFTSFADVAWEEVGKGFVAMGGLALISKFVSVGGTLMMIGLAAATYGIALAFQEFAKVEWESIGKAGVAIGGLAVAVGAMGFFWPVMAAGTLVLTAMAGAFYLFSQAIEVGAGSIDKAATSLGNLVSSITGDQLKDVGMGLVALSGGLLAFAAAGVVGGLSNLVSGFLNLVTPGKSPIEQLFALAKVGPQLKDAGEGVKALAEGMKSLSAVGFDNLKELAKFPSDKIAAMGEAIGKMRAAQGPTITASPSAGPGQVVNGASEVNAARSAPMASNNSSVVSSSSNVNNVNNSTVAAPFRPQAGMTGYKIHLAF